MLINPDIPTDFNRNGPDKELFLLFCCCVAGKTAWQQAAKLEEFIKLLYASLRYDSIGTVFEALEEVSNDWVNSMPKIEYLLRQVKMGQYKRLTHVFTELCTLDIDKVTLETLESIRGIGPKTARFYWVHTYPDVRYSILDTHILKELSSLGYKVPKSTPSKLKYLEIEQYALAEADKAGLTPAEWDIKIWLKYRHPERNVL